MPRLIKGTIINETKFCSPFRIILAGSSGSGKTKFAGNLLEKKDIFQENPESVVYYYPCYHINRRLNYITKFVLI